MERSDADLVTALRGRERGALDAVYAKHATRIWAFLVRLTGNRPDAEDLFQETWLAAARHAHRLDARDALLPWLYTIARNKHRSARRFRLFEVRKRARMALLDRPAPVMPNEEVLAREGADALSRAFGSLRAIHREVLLLCLVEGLVTKEVGAVLGLGDEAVRKRLSRARAELAARLEMEESPR